MSLPIWRMRGGGGRKMKGRKKEPQGLRWKILDEERDTVLRFRKWRQVLKS